ncbi:MAG: IS6 family transposase [Nitrososphaerota archaeon]|nr:IS6 family transposase [Thermoproteota archaeon]
MRLLRGLEIVFKGGQIRRINPSTFLVKSQSGNGWYRVKWNGKKWICNCPDHNKNGYNCKHVNAVTFLLRLPHILTINLNPEQFICPKCGADFDNIVRTGVQRNKSGLVQRYRCKVCGYRFNDREGFEKLRNNPTLVLIAVDLYLKGLSTREIAHHLSMIYGSDTSHVTIYRWVIKYLDMLRRIEKEFIKKANLGKRWHADETTVKIRGKLAYIWNILDYKTRYLLASHVSYRRDAKTAGKILIKLLNIVGSNPDKILTDKLSSYKKALKELKAKRNCRLKHISGKKFTDEINNNVIERLNKIIKKRVKSAEKFGNKRSAEIVVEGLRAYYNLIRPHLGLREKTPVEKAGLKIKSHNKLLMLLKGVNNVMNAE